MIHQILCHIKSVRGGVAVQHVALTVWNFTTVVLNNKNKPISEAKCRFLLPVLPPSTTLIVHFHTPLFLHVPGT